MTVKHLPYAPVNMIDSVSENCDTCEDIENELKHVLNNAMERLNKHLRYRITHEFEDDKDLSRKFFTVEPDMGRFSVYEWGVYERSSVLAGQQRKSFRADFETVAEAVAAYPNADVAIWRIDAGNTTNHLPDGPDTDIITEY